jgi:predicted component of type VI protein secretion system
LPKNVAAELSDQSRLQLGLLELLVSRLPDRTPDSPTTGTGPTGTLEWNRADMAAGMGAATPGRNVGHSGRVGSSSPSLEPSRPFSSATPAPSSSRSVSHPSRQGEGARPDGRPDGGRSAAAGFADAGSGQEPNLRKLLEAFAEAFIGLRKGYEQFGAEVGVRTINGATPLHRARSRSELMEYLLQPDADVAAITHDLIAIFADFGIHHIAMMQGVTEGTRSILASLSPRSSGIDAGGRLFAGVKTKNQWKEYLERFEQMIADENELHAALFGSEFARAYASVTLGEEHGAHADHRGDRGDRGRSADHSRPADQGGKDRKG